LRRQPLAALRRKFKEFLPAEFISAAADGMRGPRSDII